MLESQIFALLSISQGLCFTTYKGQQLLNRLHFSAPFRGFLSLSSELTRSDIVIVQMQINTQIPSRASHYAFKKGERRNTTAYEVSQPVCSFPAHLPTWRRNGKTSSMGMETTFSSVSSSLLRKWDAHEDTWFIEGCPVNHGHGPLCTCESTSQRTTP